MSCMMTVNALATVAARSYFVLADRQAETDAKALLHPCCVCVHGVISIKVLPLPHHEMGGDRHKGRGGGHGRVQPYASLL